MSGCSVAIIVAAIIIADVTPSPAIPAQATIPVRGVAVSERYAKEREVIQSIAVRTGPTSLDRLKKPAPRRNHISRHRTYVPQLVRPEAPRRELREPPPSSAFVRPWRAPVLMSWPPDIGANRLV